MVTLQKVASDTQEWRTLVTAVYLKGSRAVRTMDGNYLCKLPVNSYAVIHNATTENVGKDNKTSPARKGKINYAKIECNDRHVVFFFKSLISEW